MMLRQASLAYISTSIAWLKMIGTGMITVFAFLVYPEGHWFIKNMGLAVLVLELVLPVPAVRADAPRRRRRAGYRGDRFEGQTQPRRFSATTESGMKKLASPSRPNLTMSLRTTPAK